MHGGHSYYVKKTKGFSLDRVSAHTSILFCTAALVNGVLTSAALVKSDKKNKFYSRISSGINHNKVRNSVTNAVETSNPEHDSSDLRTHVKFKC